MLTRRFTPVIRLIEALVIIMLCCLLTVGASADRNDNRSKDRGSDKGAKVEHKVSTRDDSKDRKADSSRARSGDSRDSSNRQNDDRDRGQRDNQGKQDAKIKIGWPFGRLGDKTNKTDDHSDSRPDRDRNKPNDRSKDAPRIYVAHPDNDRGRPEPGHYTPPVRRGGLYQYTWHVNPVRYGHWAHKDYDRDSCRRSAFFHYGFFPYVQIGRVHIVTYISVGYRDRLITVNDGYYLTKYQVSGLQDTLRDIKEAWQYNRPDLIDRHVSSGGRIAVLLDGQYDYSMDSDDYVDMVSDALDEIRTMNFTWDHVRERVDGDYTAFGRHIFIDEYHQTRTVYVSYTFHRSGGRFIVTEVGSSTTQRF